MLSVVKTDTYLMHIRYCVIASIIIYAIMIARYNTDIMIAAHSYSISELKMGTTRWVHVTGRGRRCRETGVRGFVPNSRCESMSKKRRRK